MNNKKILVLSPHTDDAELGAGGYVIKSLENNCQIFWVVFSTAEESLPQDLPPDTLAKEFISVMNKLNISEKEYTVYNFKVRKLHEKRQEILEILIKLRAVFKPDIVIGPSLNDFHQDHVIIANEMIRAYKMSSSILCYELPWNNIKFENQYFVKLTEQQMDKKINLLRCYNSQLLKNRNYFSKEFIMSLARTRGVQVNTTFAEAFEVIRWVE